MLAGVSWLYWLLAFVLSAALTLYYYRWLFPSWGKIGRVKLASDSEVVNRSWWLLAVALRWLGLFSIVILLLNPWWVLRTSNEVKPVFLVYLDSSLSSDNQDLNTAQKWIHSQLDLGNNTEVRFHSFGSEVRYNRDNKDGLSRNMDSLWRNSTNFELVFKDVEECKHNSPVAGVLLVSDGIVNQGIDPNFLNKNTEVPYFFIGMGDPTLYPDIAVKSVLVNDEVLLNGITPIELQLVSQAFKGNAVVELMVDGRIVESKVLVFSQQRESQKMIFDWKQKSPGNHQISIRVLPLKNEKNIFNNEAVKMVRVVDDKKRILLISDIVDPDIGCIRRALKNWEQFSIQVVSRDAIGSLDENADIIIVKGLKSELSMQELKKWQAQGKPVWFMVSNGADLNFLSSVLGLRNSAVVWQDVQAGWNNQYSGFSLDNRLATRISGYPPLQVPMISTESLHLPSEDVLLWQRWGGSLTQMPLHWVVKTGALSRVMVSLGNGFWKWRLNEFQEYGSFEGFDQWMRRSIMILNAMVDKPKRVEIQLSDRVADETKPILGRVIYRDGDGKINNDIKIELTVKMLGEERKNHSKVSSIALNRGATGSEFKFQSFMAGRYEMLATVNVGGKVFEDRELVLVNRVPMELINHTANHQWMQNIANVSKGDFAVIGNLSNFQKRIAEKIQSQSFIRVDESQTYWWKIKWLLLLLVFSFGGEWALRKWLGKY